MGMGQNTTSEEQAARATYECPECNGGILRDAAGRDERCDMCEGKKRLPGFLTLEGEVVDGAVAREIHFSGDGCVVEGCVWCARELSEARAMHGAGGAPVESSETYREQMIDAGRGRLLRN